MRRFKCKTSELAPDQRHIPVQANVEEGSNTACNSQNAPLRLGGPLATLTTYNSITAAHTLDLPDLHFHHEYQDAVANAAYATAHLQLIQDKIWA